MSNYLYLSRKWLASAKSTSAENIISSISNQDNLVLSITDHRTYINLTPTVKNGEVTEEDLNEYISKIEILSEEVKNYCEAVKKLKNDKFSKLKGPLII